MAGYGKIKANHGAKGVVNKPAKNVGGGAGARTVKKMLSKEYAKGSTQGVKKF